MVDVAVLVKLYFEPSLVHPSQPQALPDSICDLDHTSGHIIATACLAKAARRRTLNIVQICSRDRRLGSNTKSCGRASGRVSDRVSRQLPGLPANANTSPKLPPKTPGHTTT